MHMARILELACQKVTEPSLFSYLWCLQVVEFIENVQNIQMEMHQIEKRILACKVEFDDAIKALDEKKEEVRERCPHPSKCTTVHGVWFCDVCGKIMKES